MLVALAALAAYGQTFKDRAAARLLPPEGVAAQVVAREVGIEAGTSIGLAAVTPDRYTDLSARSRFSAVAGATSCTGVRPCGRVAATLRTHWARCGIRCALLLILILLLINIFFTELQTFSSIVPIFFDSLSIFSVSVTNFIFSLAAF
jgi:hypothetical protein